MVSLFWIPTQKMTKAGVEKRKTKQMVDGFTALAG